MGTPYAASLGFFVRPGNADATGSELDQGPPFVLKCAPEPLRVACEPPAEVRHACVRVGVDLCLPLRIDLESE